MFRRRSTPGLVVVFGIILSLLGGPALAQDASPVASPVAEEATSTFGDPDLDVLFIGAHPDDEAFGLATYGQWNELDGVRTGVITVTRGEGGGNAVGTEEGPALGLIREDEERRAVSAAGIEHIYNLDKVDFYYTVSAPLTIQTWDYEDTLSRVVRVIRSTTPEVIITMNPAPTPGQHGHHQVAARLAIDAFAAAADPTRFPEQIEDEGLHAWSASSIFQNGASGQGTPGPDCATTFVPTDPTQTIFGIWQGTISEANGGRTWGEVARDGQRQYASQGWAVFPDASSDPAEIGCNQFTLIDTRVPLSINPASTTAMLENAVIPTEGGMPLGSEFYLTTSTFSVLPGEEFTVTANLSMPFGAELSRVTFDVPAPEGWEVTPGTPAEGENGAVTQDFVMVPPADAEAGGRHRIEASVAAYDGTGVTNEVVEIAPAVSGIMAPLPEIAQFQEWATEIGMPQLNSLLLPVSAIGVGQTETISVNLVNNSAAAQSGTVSLELPAGFSAAEATAEFADLAPGASTSVTFDVTNDDAMLPTSNEGGEGGTYPVSITTEASGSVSVQQAGLNLVPVTVVPPSTDGVAVDGAISEGEYTGEALDLGRIWEGQELEGDNDADGQAWVSWSEDGIYIAVQVTDDTLGTIVTPEDAKRHWRTDTVEIAIDPLGTAPNTSATFKVGVFPTTTDGSPQASRDADAWQGPVSETAPGFEVASALTDPYTGYVLETFIPFESLPADIDPDNAAMNIFVYDSDATDLTGQTRIGWSTWNGVQGDPYRWGRISLEGFDQGATPVALASPVADSAAPEVDAPVMPLDVTQSTRSPQSIAQSAADGVPLAGLPPVAEGTGLTFLRIPTVAGSNLTIDFESKSTGTAVYFVVAEDGTVISEGEIAVEIGRNEHLGDATGGTSPATLLVSFQTTDGDVEAFSFPLET